MGIRIFYHGTDIDSAKDICTSQKINLQMCSRRADFGRGFYVTEDFERAKKWATVRSYLRNKKPAVITAKIDIEAAEPFIEYFNDDLRWGRFIINNRNGLQYINKVAFKENNLDARYQITCGRIADFDVKNVARELNSTGEMLMDLEQILNLQFPIQYAFHTDESILFIKNFSYRVV